MKNPPNPKERGLLKGAIRRVFSRSELRKEALGKTSLPGYRDPARSRVTKWSWCASCGEILPTYTLEVDHRRPIIPVSASLETLTWDEVVDNTWCELDNLNPVCKPCHKDKTRLENKLRKNSNSGRKKPHGK